MNYYETLGVAKDATQDEIKKAYRKMAQKYHPDRNRNEDTTERFQEIQKAYSTLKDTQKRAIYDNPRSQHSQHTFRTGNWRTGVPGDIYVDITGLDGLDPEEIIEILRGNGLGGLGGFGRRPRQKPVTRIVISLEEAYHGTKRTLNNNEFRIPKGVRNGNKLAVDDTIVIVDISAHPKFKRANDNLLVGVEISAIEAMLGLDCTIDGLDGKTIKFSIPKGTQHGQMIRLKGKGMPNPEISYIGDLLVQVVVTIPDNLTDKELDSIMELTHRKTIDI